MSNPVRPADREEFSLNPITGQLDLVRIFDPNRIITHERNAAGSLLSTYDSFSGTQIADGPKVVVDNNGNVVFL